MSNDISGILMQVMVDVMPVAQNHVKELIREELKANGGGGTTAWADSIADAFQCEPPVITANGILGRVSLSSDASVNGGSSGSAFVRAMVVANGNQDTAKGHGGRLYTNPGGDSWDEDLKNIIHHPQGVPLSNGYGHPPSLEPLPMPDEFNHESGSQYMDNVVEKSKQIIPPLFSQVVDNVLVDIKASIIQGLGG